MKRLLSVVLIFCPLVVSGYSDHRGHNLDSLERVTARYTPDRLRNCSDADLLEYVRACCNLAWGYLQIDGVKTIYYGRQATALAEKLDRPDAVFDMSILIGQCFTASEQYDSARLHYGRAAKVLRHIETGWTDPDLHDLEACQARLWGTLGNFYAAQDSLSLFKFYYDKAGVLFEKWGWWEDCSTLHRNIGELYMEQGLLKEARPELERAMQFARASGDSLLISGALYSLGHWCYENGQTRKALKYVTEAYEYFGNHPIEEAGGRADVLEIMNAAHKQLYRRSRIMSIGFLLLLILAAIACVVAYNLIKTRQALAETSSVLDETIEELRQDGSAPAADIHLTRREKEVASLLMEGQPSKQIAQTLGISSETVLWYRKRIFAKLNVHSAAALATEVMKRGLLEPPAS